jgi:hypothetical protein
LAEQNCGCEFETAQEAEQDRINLFEGFYSVNIDNIESLIKGQVD